VVIIIINKCTKTPVKQATFKLHARQPETSLLTTQKAPFNNIKSAPKQSQTQPKTPAKPKTQLKKQTETTPYHLKKFFLHLY